MKSNHKDTKTQRTQKEEIRSPLKDNSVSSSRGMLKGTKVSTHSLLELRKEEKVLEERKLERE